MHKRVIAAIVAALALALAAPVACASAATIQPVTRTATRVGPATITTATTPTAATCAAYVGKPAPQIGTGTRYVANYALTRTSVDYLVARTMRKWVNYRGPEVWLSAACGGTITTFVYRWSGAVPNWM